MTIDLLYRQIMFWKIPTFSANDLGMVSANDLGMVRFRS